MRHFIHGSPVSRLWVIYAAIGATGTGLLSIPSYGPPAALIPLFIMAGLITSAGAWRRARRTSVVGLAVLSIAAWARALAVWGVGQHGAGSSILAAGVWWWLSVGALMLATEISRRGIR